MLQGGIPIGKIWCISLRLHYSWFLIFILITWALTTSYFPSSNPNWSLSTSIAAGIITSLLFFGSVLFHELMHSRVALWEGMTVHSIVLFALGGVSQINGEPRSARDEFWMAFAGPATSLVLGGIFLGVWMLSQNSTQFTEIFVASIAYYLGFINVALGVFNLVPGFPLDGGRVFRSILWGINHDMRKSTRIASNVGQLFGFLFILIGVWLIFTGNFFNGLWLAFIGWFLASSASGSYQQLVLQDMLKGHVASEVMVRECTAVRPNMTLEDVVNNYILAANRRCFPVATDGRLQGLLTLDNVRAVSRDRWNSTTVNDAMVQLDKLKSVRPDDDLAKVMQIMTENDISQVPVVQDREIVGMIGRDNLINFMNIRSQTVGG